VSTNRDSKYGTDWDRYSNYHREWRTSHCLIPIRQVRREITPHTTRTRFRELRVNPNH